MSVCIFRTRAYYDDNFTLFVVNSYGIISIVVTKSDDPFRRSDQPRQRKGFALNGLLQPIPAAGHAAGVKRS